MSNDSLIKVRDWVEAPGPVAPLSSYTAYSAEPQAGSALAYWGVLCRSKLAIAVLGAVGLAIGIGVGLLQSPAYQATTSLEIQDQKDDVLGTKLFNPNSESPVSSDPSNDIQTQIKILQSRSLIERALDKSGIGSPEDLGSDFARLKRLFNLPAKPAASSGGDELVEKVAKNLHVTSAGQTRIIEISFEASDPLLAARFTNALTAEYIEQNLQARLLMSRKTSEWLLGQVDDLRGKLKHSEDALQSYARENGLVYTGDKQSISEEKLRQLQSELSKAQSDRVEKESRYEIARGTRTEIVPEVLNDSSLRAMENSLTDLRRQEAELAVTFKPDYTKTKRIRAEIEALEAAVAGKGDDIVARLDNELKESQRREQMLASAYSHQTRLVADDSEKSVQYDMLKHDVDTNRQVYQAMLQRVKESTVASALKATNVRVLDPAKVPSRPVKPNLPLNSLGGLLCGLMLGISAVLFRSKVNGSIQEPGEASQLFGIPELGAIPASNRLGIKTGARSQLSIAGGKKTSRHLLLSEIELPALADSFRAVLASILFTETKNRHRVLVVTSASPAEGKTTTISNLGVALANMRGKVLLIDGDIRSPRLHDIFGLDNTEGLTTVLQQIATSATNTETFIQQTSTPNLDVLTSGPDMQAGVDLLFSRTMPALIAQLRDQYDMILIDTPPMLIMPDARVLGRVSDAVVLVARAGQTARTAMQAAVRRFVEDQTPILGVVLNDWNIKNSAYKYYSDYQRSAMETAVAKPTPAGV
jgi:capsular exopolysaccharide synthesis family protein